VKTTIAKSVAAIVLGLGLCSPFSNLQAAVPAVDECSKELLLAYFPEPFLNETLKKFNVPQEKWATIAKALSENDKKVIANVEEKASKMNPNPLKDPQRRHEAVKIFRETLFETFAGVMKDNGITDETQIHAMLDDVQQQKAKRFAQCMERQRAQTPQKPVETPKPAEPAAPAPESAPNP
jgi:hypothetical protein